MVRYAAHRVYLQPDNRVLERQMVELDAGGEVLSVAPFCMEVHHTIWVDGLIFLSVAPPPQPHVGESFAQYLNRLASLSCFASQPATNKMRAYRINGLDIPAMLFRSTVSVSPLL